MVRRNPTIVRWLMSHLPALPLRRLVWSAVRRREFDFEAATRFDAIMRGNTRDLIQRYICYFGVWEPSTTAWVQGRLAPGDVFVDVGANIGYYTLLASKVVGAGGRVVAIEAFPEIFALLEQQVALNGAGNARLIQLAAADRSGELSIAFGGEHNIGSSSIVDAGSSGERHIVIRGEPLDHVLTDEERRRVRLIKIDVEGAERQVVGGLGLASTIYRRDLELIVEITPDRWPDRGSPAEFLQQMKAYGFNAYLLDEPLRFRHYLPGAATQRPVRITNSIDRYATVVFSRLDRESL